MTRPNRYRRAEELRRLPAAPRPEETGTHRRLAEIALAADSELRRRERQLRLRHVAGNRATADCIAEDRETRDEALRRLVHAGIGARMLASAVAAEGHLARRISTARDAGQDRPELRERLTAVRRRIRTLSRDTATAEEAGGLVPHPTPEEHAP